MRCEAKNRGFTLVELLIYIALFGILSTFIYSLFIQNFKTYSSQQNSMVMTQDLRAAIGFVDDADDRYNTDANSIHFTMDIDDDAGSGSPDGDVDDENEDVNYYLYTTDGIQKLGRRTGGGNPQPIAENIASLTFSYTFADGDIGVPDLTDGDTTNDLDDIRAVQITITAETAEIDPLTKQKKTKAYTTTVKIRNLGF